MGRINQDCISSEPEWFKVHETPNPILVIVFTSAVYAKYGAQDTWHKIVKTVGPLGIAVLSKKAYG